MELAMNNGFVELSMDDMCEIDGGGAWEAVQAFTGCVLVGISIYNKRSVYLWN